MTTLASRDTALAFLVPDMPTAADLAPYLARVDAARWYSNFGPLATELEAGLAGLMGPGVYAVCVANGHAAIEIALKLRLDGVGKRVLVPDFTFASTMHAVLNTGHVPVLADVDAETWCLTPAIARHLRDVGVAFDAVLPVAAFGRPLDAGEWDAFAAETGIAVVMDAAAALEAQKIPACAVVCHSLHATKPFGIGEGGIIATRDEAFAERAREACNFGFRNRAAGGYGTNAKLSEYHAAVGLAQLARWPANKQRRAALWQAARAALAPLGADALQADHADIVAGTLALCLAPGAPDPDAAIAALADAGIQAARPYLPLMHAHPYFAEAAQKSAAAFPANERIGARMIALPFHPRLTPDDLQRMAGILISMCD